MSGSRGACPVAALTDDLLPTTNAFRNRRPLYVCGCCCCCTALCGHPSSSERMNKWPSFGRRATTLDGFQPELFPGRCQRAVSGYIVRRFLTPLSVSTLGGHHHRHRRGRGLEPAAKSRNRCPAGSAMSGTLGGRRRWHLSTLSFSDLSPRPFITAE